MTDSPVFVDTHSHLDAECFDKDRDSVLERARRAAVRQQLIPAVNAHNWRKIRDLCRTHDGLFASYGFHPMYLPRRDERHIRELTDWLDIHAYECHGIGECGLDFYIADFDAENQQWFLDRQLRIARDRGLPVVLHARKAVDAILASIRRFAPLTGIVHSYPGSLEQAERLFDMGFVLGIGGPVTYERANRLRRVVREMPLESLVLETDAPDQPNSDRRGERNEPANLLTVAETVAQLRGIDVDQLARVTTATARQLFKLPDAS